MITKQSKYRAVWARGAMVVLLLFGTGIKASMAEEEEKAGVIEKFQGVVKVHKGGGPRGKRVTDEESEFYTKDTVVTKRGSRAFIRFVDGVKNVLEENSILEVKGLRDIHLKGGRAIFEVRKLKGVKGIVVTTQTVVIGVKGTRFMVDLTDGRLSVFLKEGRLNVQSLTGDFRRYKKKELDEFETFRLEKLDKFEEYKKKMEEEFVEFVKEFEMEGGTAILIDGDEVRDIGMSPEIEEEFELLSLFGSERIQDSPETHPVETDLSQPLKIQESTESHPVEPDFERWKQKELQDFQDLKDKRDKEFLGFLDKQWKEFELSKGLVRDEAPKPQKVPVAKKEPPKDLTPPKGEKIKDIPMPKPTPLPALPETGTDTDTDKKPLPDIYKKGKGLKINFYNTQITINCDLKSTPISQIDNKAISAFWETMSRTDYDSLTKQTKYYKETLRLNDWGYHLLLFKIGEAIYHEDLNQTNLFLWFMSSKSGYESRIAYNKDRIFFFLPSRDLLYGVSYLTIDEKKYYAISFDGMEENKFDSLFTYEGKYPEADRLVSYAISSLPEIKKSFGERSLSFRHQGKTYKIPITFNKNLVDYFKFYPQTNLDVYFNAPVPYETEYALVEKLKPLIEDKTEAEALNILLSFVQTTLDYKTDGGQFGHEKYMLPEETFFYPYSDCEDRSFLFAFLVRRLLGLEVVGLHYPGHVATAVRISDDKIDGDYITYKGKRFIVSDPTYINADIGMAMSQFKGVTPKIILIK